MSHAGITMVTPPIPIDALLSSLPSGAVNLFVVYKKKVFIILQWALKNQSLPGVTELLSRPNFTRCGKAFC